MLFVYCYIGKFPKGIFKDSTKFFITKTRKCVVFRKQSLAVPILPKTDILYAQNTCRTEPKKFFSTIIEKTVPQNKRLLLRFEKRSEKKPLKIKNCTKNAQGQKNIRESSVNLEKHFVPDENQRGLVRYKGSE